MSLVKDKKAFLLFGFLSIFAIALSYLSITEFDRIGYVVLAGILASLWVDKNLPFYSYVCAMVMDCQLNTNQLMVVMAVIGYSCFKSIRSNPNVLNENKSWVVLILSVITLSFLVGISPQLTVFLLIIFGWLISCNTAVLTSNNNDKMLKASLAIGGISMMIIMMILLAQSGGMVFRRLAYHENIKIIATAVAFPIYHLTYYLIAGNENKHLLFKIGALLVVLSCLVILFFTYARGVLIAVVLSISWIYYKSLFPLNLGKIFMSAIVLCMGVYVITNINLDNELLFDNIEGGHGRTEIWEMFYSRMKKEGFITLLLGFGPGDLKRLFIDIYAHSVILDYFFSFGIAGFTLFMTLLWKIGKTLIKYGDVYYTGLLILTIVMYFPHGSASVVHFYILYGMVMGAAFLNKYKRQNIAEV